MRKVVFFILLNTFIFSQTIQELRGVWLTSTSSVVLESDQNIVNAVNYLASIGVNVIFPVVYNQGYTLYPSDVMYYHFGVKTINKTAYSTRDFLERLIIEAHRVGIEVIPWFEYGFAASYSLNGGHIVAKYPHWAAKNVNGELVVKNGFDWLNGIHPEVQNYMTSLVTEVIRKYDIDGIQGDDRLPSMPYEAGYDTYTVNLYKSENNNQNPPNDPANSAWVQWRANKLTQYLSKLKDSVKKYSSHLILSSSPTPYPWGLNQYLQDSKTWVQQNLVDIIHPQIYRKTTAEYTTALNESITNIRNYAPNKYYPGILIQSGSYIATSALLNDIINTNRNNNINGEVHFFYEGFKSNNNELGNLVYTNFYNQPALLPYRNGKIFRPKATIVNENDAGNKKYGNWITSANSGYQGNLYKNTDNTIFSAIDYYLNVPFDAYFDVYAWIYASSENFNNVRYIIYKTNGDSIVTRIDQSASNKYGWQKIGTVYLTKGTKRVFRVDNNGLVSGKSIYADAGMIMINRKLSPDVVIDPSNQQQPSYETRWLQSVSNSSLPTWFGSNTERGLAYLNNEVLIVSRNGGTFLKRLSSSNGTFIANMSTTGVSGGTFLLNDVEVSSDGKIFVCNLSTNSGSSPFIIYKWDNVNSNPTSFISYNTGSYRLGDNFTVIGNTSTQAYIYVGVSGTKKILRWKILNGNLVSSTPTEIDLNVANNLNYPISIAPVEASDNSNFYVSASNLMPTLFNSSGGVLATIGSNNFINFPSSIKYFEYANKKYLAVCNCNQSNTNILNQNLVVIDVTNGLNNIYQNDFVIITNSLGSSSNVNATGDIAVNVLSNSVDFYLLATNNGIANFYSNNKPLPVEYSDLSIKKVDDYILLLWTTKTEINNHKFVIEKYYNEQWNEIATIYGKGNSSTKNNYAFKDFNILPGKNQYKIKQIDFDGKYQYSDIIEFDNKVTDFKILSVYPNPFNPNINLRYYVPYNNKVTIKIYNSLGQEVTTLIDKYQENGTYELQFDGKNLTSGVYFCNFYFDNRLYTKKIMLLK